MSHLNRKFDIGFSNGVAYIKFRGIWDIEDAISYEKETLLLKKTLNPSTINNWIGLIDLSDWSFGSKDAIDIITDVRLNSFHNKCRHNFYYIGNNKLVFSLFYFSSLTNNEKLNGFFTYHMSSSSLLKRMNMFCQKNTLFSEIDINPVVINDFVLGKKELSDLL